MEASERAFCDSGEWSESQSTNSEAGLAVFSRVWIELKSSGQLTARMRSTLAGYDEARHRKMKAVYARAKAAIHAKMHAHGEGHSHG